MAGGYPKSVSQRSGGDAREAAGLNQTQLGKAVGRAQSFVSNYERGQRRLDLPDLILVCRVLKVDPRELLGWLS
ncbi:MAG TPA: helix-turn-helix transcriptional regulator [Allosphingosinicella sp.]